MSYRPSYVSGDYKAICDVCGRIYKSTELKQRWDGLKVCSADFELRQPQDFVRGVADIQAPKWTRPENTDSFINACTTNTSIAGFAIAGCMIVGNNVNPGLVPRSSFVV